LTGLSYRIGLGDRFHAETCQVLTTKKLNKKAVTVAPQPKKTGDRKRPSFGLQAHSKKAKSQLHWGL
jgi:hypothetical protein